MSRCNFYIVTMGLNSDTELCHHHDDHVLATLAKLMGGSLHCRPLQIKLPTPVIDVSLICLLQPMLFALYLDILIPLTSIIEARMVPQNAARFILFV